jgi:hypothetical protein
MVFNMDLGILPKRPLQGHCGSHQARHITHTFYRVSRVIGCHRKGTGLDFFIFAPIALQLF